MLDYIGSEFQELLLWIVRQLYTSVDTFKSPGYLILLLCIPAYLFWYVWWYAPRRLIVPLSYDPQKLTKKRGSFGILRVLPHILSNIALFFLIIALARPITRNEFTERYSEGIDIMLLLDTSGSMEIDDFEPNRLEVAKKTAIEFVNGRDGDQIGIVLFAEDAYGYAPLTLDYDLLREYLEKIDADMMPKEGTAMGSAIAVGINKMSAHKSPSKVMILLTDGASNRGEIDPITAANLAKRDDIKIHAIGIGKEEYTRRSMFGTQTVKSDLDEETLKEIAKITGGQFFRSEDEGRLQEIFSLISQMERIEIEGQSITEERDHYQPILLTGSIFLVVALLVALTFVYNPLEG